VRILLKKTQEGWKVRFPSGNPWKMPVAEWLSVTGNFHEAPAHIVTAHLMAAAFQSSNVFTLCPIGEDLEQVDPDEQAAWQQGKLSESNLNQTEFGPSATANKCHGAPLGRMDDEELAAIYEYLTHLPGP
jgi:hypothetical protein